MRLRSAVFRCWWWWCLMIVSVHGQNDQAEYLDHLQCPFETNKTVIGYKTWDRRRCVTLHHVNPADFSVVEDFVHQSNKMCNKAFKNGYLRSYVYEKSFEKELETSIAMDFWSGVEITWRSDEYYTYRGYFRYFYKYDYTLLYFLEKDKPLNMKVTRGQDWNNAGTWEIYGEDGEYHTSDEMWQWRQVKWNSQFNNHDRNKPLCLMYQFNHNKITPAAVIDCVKLKEYKQPILMPCQHDAYKSCVVTMYKKCTKIPVATNKYEWFQERYEIKQHPELPWGKPCPKFRHSIPCTPKCTGPATEWTKMNGSCAYGGTFRRSRKIAFSPDKPKCETDADLCCEEMDEQTVTDCYHYTQDLKTLINETSCLNGGRMEVDNTGHRMCTCPVRYEGVTCETDRCAERCANGGTCIPSELSLVCQCPPGYTGERCTDVTQACGDSKTCKNGGTCITKTVDGKTISYCQCTQQFVGEMCESRAEECKETTCLQRGTCIQNKQTREVTCICNAGFTGDRCGQRTGLEGLVLETLQSTTGSFMVVVVICCCLAGLVFFAGGTHVVRKRRRRRRRHATTDSTMSTQNYSVLSRFSRMAKRDSSTMSTKKMNSNIDTMNSKVKSTKK